MANKYGETRMKTNLKWGDNVTTTQKAINKNIFSEHRRGIYLGGIKYSLSITVVCKGQKTPQKYHPSFWKKLK